MATKRARGTGSITWLDTGRARLRVRVGQIQRSKVIRVAHRNHGGRGEAAEALEEFMAEIEAGHGSTGATMTVDGLFGRYIEQVERMRRRSTTIESYKMVRKRLTPELASIRLADLTTDDIDTFIESLTLRDNSIRHTHAVLRAALNLAVRRGWIAANPAATASPPPRERLERPPLPPSDVARLVMTAAAPKAEGGDEDLVLAMAIAVASMTGARRGELCGLRWDDIDPTACTIRIERQWVADKGGQHLADPKTHDGKRTVWLGTEGMAIIERYRGLLAALTDHEPFGWLLSPEGTEKPMRAKALGQNITDLGKRVDLKVTTHSFRRVAATELVAAGVDVDTAARRMGHTKEVMFGSYVLGADDRQVAAANLVEARLIEQGLKLGELLPFKEAP